ncbi:hypothetical protein K3495_g2275 [Podosphaera aphanis]|nr:hypothetical protein K3495_g2275 [Podosphaera aphanis]
MKISISECLIDSEGYVRWRDRLVVPKFEPLQTALIHKVHDSPITGHPGREGTLSILARHYYSPRMSNMVRRFVRNCEVCGRTHVWRDKKRGFLKPLPVPERFHQELSIGFVTALPAEKNQPRYLMVMAHRLSKEIILEAMSSMRAEDCAQRFLQCFYRFHEFSRAITSDRGSNWVGRLSTAFHLRRMGLLSEPIKKSKLLSRICNLRTDRLVRVLPAAQLALSNRDSSLGYSLFYQTHGYYVPPFPTANINANLRAKSVSPKAPQADLLIKKLEEGHALAQSAMIWRQQVIEDSANRGYPLPSQKQEDYQPDPIDSSVPRMEQEFEIERILKAKNQRRGRGFQRLVPGKWKGQAEPTWERRDELEDTVALDTFEREFGKEDGVGENTGM